MSFVEVDWRNGETLEAATTQGDDTPRAGQVPGLTLLAHPDIRRIGERVVLPQLALGHSASLSRLEPIFRRRGAPKEEAGLPLAERAISRRPIRLLGDPPTGGVIVDAGETPTPLTVDGQKAEGRLFLSAERVRRGAVFLVGRRIALLLHPMLLPPEEEPSPPGDLVGQSDGLVAVRQEIERLARLDVPVLVRGESGTGKELVARALHGQGRRREQPFVAVNMATLTPSLAAAELFGAVRGAFTGADRKKVGLFRGAHGGTLFLDEIGETPVEVQAMLLRALESREILPVGGVTAEPVDVRVIAATDARLEQAMREGRFREPLYHRLAGYTLHIPPLRQRLDDLGRLLVFFLDLESGTSGDGKPVPFPPARVVERLARHPWPGNVRELRNVARRMVLVGHRSASKLLAQLEGVLAESTAEVSTAEVFVSQRAPALPSPTEAVAGRVPPTPRRRHRRPEDVGEGELLAALEANDYRIRETAAALDLSRIGLYRRIESSPEVITAKDLDSREIEKALTACGGDLESAARSLRVSLQGLKRRITALHTELPSLKKV